LPPNLPFDVQLQRVATGLQASAVNYSLRVVQAFSYIRDFIAYLPAERRNALKTGSMQSGSPIAFSYAGLGLRDRHMTEPGIPNP